MAAALIVPLGAVGLSATSAGATSNTNTAACHSAHAKTNTAQVPVGGNTTVASNAGQTAGATSNNGVLTRQAYNGNSGSGLRLTVKNPQQFSLTGANQLCTGGVVNAGRTIATFTTATPVNCQTLHKTTLGGSGKFTWTDPSGMGTTSFNIHVTWTSNTSISFNGAVTSTGSSSNVFKGQQIHGTINTSTSLAAVASGGNCSNNQSLTKLYVNSITYTIG